MFTGLIRGLGRIAGKQQSSNHASLSIKTELATGGWALGDSIAVNGVCLTIARFESGGFAADIMPETWRGTNLSGLKHGDRVNLEPALAVGERFGGHMVSGHVDGVGRISRMYRETNAVLIQIKVASEIGRGIVHKGSVAVNGVSLTVQRVMADGFVISLIPHTLQETTFQFVQRGEMVNIENDLLAKHRLDPKQAELSQTGITTAFLAENGFFK